MSFSLLCPPRRSRPSLPHCPLDGLLPLQQKGFQPLAVQLQHGVHAGAYRQTHRDPFDRLLAAQAELDGLQLESQPREIQTNFSFHRPLAHQGEVGLESGSVADAGIELDAGGKQSASIEASSCLPLAFCSLSLAFSCFSRSVSLSICSISCASCFIRHSCRILRRS
jgi:hypothetical protein